MKSSKPKRKVIAGQPSYVLASKDVELGVTELGGHMAPVTFYRKTSGPVQPYYISPWQGEGLKIDEPVLVPLRGDFFCMPFGAPGVWRGVKHNCHGEPAGGKWTLEGIDSDGPVSSLTMTMKTASLPGKVTKRLCLVEGHNVVYCQHVLEGYSTAVSLGHHALLAVPDRLGALRVAVSPFKLGMTNPVQFSNPEVGEYQSLAVNRKFTKLDRVPLEFKSPAYGDFSRFPQRAGYTDLLGIWARDTSRLAWATATNEDEGYLWFSLKDPDMLPATVLWVSNRGRHGLPWNGRNRCLGLEDVCSYFAEPAAVSAATNQLNKMDIPTTVPLSRSRPTVVNYIQGVVKVPKGFECVKEARFANGAAMFTSVTGRNVTVPVCHEFLRTGLLKKQ